MENLTIESITKLTGDISGFLWGNAVTFGVLLGVGVYLTFKLGFPQIRAFRMAVRIVRGKQKRHGEVGDVTHYQALATALSATVGVGNIAGVGTAIALGGPGALFWMWMTAFLGMATKMTECTLALKYREVRPDGSVAGGPMYTLLHGLKMKRLAILFATFTVIASFGIGNMVQANSVVDGLAFIWPGVKENSWFIGVIMAIVVGLVILGGVQRIARFATAVVPVMALLYLFSALLVLINHFADIPGAFVTIFNYALNPWAVGGAAIGEAIRWGVARGLFSNEAGLGSSPMAHAAARTNEPASEGMVAMLEPFIDTLIICTLTGLVIVVTGVYVDRPQDLMGSALTAKAFSVDLGLAGAWVVGIGLTLFAFSTIVSWSYYGDRAATFLFGDHAVFPYRVVYTCLVVVGAAVPVPMVWNIADTTNILMAIPNLIAVVLLAGIVRKLTDEYLQQHGGKRS